MANLVRFTEYQTGKAQLPRFPSSGSTQEMLGNPLFPPVPFNPNECNHWGFFFSFENTVLTFPGAHSVPSSGGPFLVLQK